MNHSTVSGCGEIEHSENSRKSGQQKQTVKKLHSCPIACVGATIGRPSTYRSNAFSGIVSCKANGRGRAMLAPTRVFRQPGGRIYAARQCTANGRLWETRGPGMPGPYRAAAKKRTPTQPSRRGSAAESLPLTPSPQTPLLPPSRRSPPFPPYRRC